MSVRRLASGRWFAELKAGRVPITYQTVACTVSGNMAYQFKDGSHEFWTAIQIRNHKIQVTKVEAKKNGVYAELTRSDYNYFIDDKGVKDDPIALRITSADGQVLEDTMPVVNIKSTRPRSAP